ncbi:MAG: site-2 protease family protein [Anaerolineae bacterium]
MRSLAVIPSLLTVVLIHEIGHVLAAVAGRVGIREIMLGLGRVLLSFNVGGARLSIRLWPVGGGVDIDEEGWAAAPLWAQRAMLLGGPAANIAGAWLMFAAGKLMATQGMAGLTVRLKDCVLFATSMLWSLMAATAQGFAQCIWGGASGRMFIGPVGAAAWFHQEVEYVSLPVWLVVTGAFSAGAGLFNLLPLPPLDGGRAVIAGARARLGMRGMHLIERAGVAVLVLFGIVVALQDIVILLTGP